MGLEAGSRLGRFEILSLAGVGGMGEVYRARDPELGREVAIKILPSELAADAERVRRFEREARAAGQLDHPNLLAVHDVGRHEGAPYLVCELLEGQTLRDRLESGPLGLAEALHVATQIADGLAVVHERDIVHRDLKPENVFIARGGRAKILDFGLAKLTEDTSAGETHSPTLTAATHAGALLGTVGYMSPEQAAGRPVDHRCDQFSLGAVLYETLTGRRAFAGDSGLETLAAILREEPEPLARAAPAAPPPLRWIVERCLAKDPAQRYASTADLAADLRTLRDRLPELERPEVEPAAGGRRVRLAAAALVAVAALAVGGLVAAFYAGRRVGDEPPLSWQRITFRRGTVTEARFDPDGESVLYSAAWDGEPGRIFLHRSGDLDPIPIGPEDAILRSVAPGGEILLTTRHVEAGPFLRAGTLARMPVTGAPRVIGEGVTDAAWGPDGSLAAVVRDAGGEAVLEYPPGTRRYATGMIWSLRASPDGRRVAFLDIPSRGTNSGPIVVLGPDGEERRLASAGGRTGGDGIAWAPSGEEIWFTRGGSIYAVDLAGEERTVARLPQRVVLFDIAPDGRVLLAVDPGRFEMVGRAPGSSTQRELTWLAWSVPFDLSADGGTILFNECSTGTCYVCLRGFDEAPPVVLGEGFAFTLSPDGSRAASLPPWQPTRLSILPTGPGERRDFTIPGVEKMNFAAWSPSGEAIFISANAPGEATRIYRVDPHSGAAVPVTPEGIRFGLFAVAPDGERVAAQVASGEMAIFLVDGGPAHLLSEIREQPIRWSADGRFLYTLSHSWGELPTEIGRVEVATGARERAVLLMPPDPAGVQLLSPVAISPDGDALVYGLLRRLSELFVVEGME